MQSGVPLVDHVCDHRDVVACTSVPKWTATAVTNGEVGASRVYDPVTVTSMVRLLPTVFCFAFMLAASCRTATDPQVKPERASAEAAPALHVVAVVDQIERNGYQDFITDGSVISWTLITFTVVGPDTAWGTTVRAYCSGHPVL